MFKDKPVDFVKTANLLNFEKTVNKHGNYYNFANSEDFVNDFLINIRSRFKMISLKLIKYAFVV